MSFLDKARSHLVRNRHSIRKATHNAVVVTAGLAASRLCSFIIAIILARVSGAAAFGEYTLFITVFVLASEIPGALDTTYLRFANAPGSSGKRYVYLSVDLYAKYAYLLLVALLAWTLTPWLSVYVFEKPQSADILRYAMLAGAIYSVFTTLIASYQQQFKFYQVSILRLVFNLCVLAVVGAVVFNGVVPAQNDVSIIYLSVAVILAVTTQAVLFRKVGRHEPADRELVANYLKVGGILLLSATINLTSARLDIFFLTKYVAFDDLGLYGIAVRFSIVISLLTAAISTVMMPKASGALHSPGRFRRYMGLAAFYAVGQTALALLVLAYIEPLILYLFGQTYVAAAQITTLLIMQVLLTSYGIPFQALVQCGRKPSLMLLITSGKLVAGLLLMPLVIPRYGLYGAAATVTVMTGGVTALLMLTALAQRPQASKT